MGYPETKRTVPAESFVATLSVNVDNKKLSDAEFREFVRNTLSIVIYPVPAAYLAAVYEESDEDVQTRIPKNDEKEITL